MSFQEQIQQQIKQSLKDGDRLRLSTLRMLMAAIQQKEIDTRTDLSDSECLSIVEKQVQLRLEAAEQYQHCLLYTSPSPRDRSVSRMPSSA